MKTKVLSVIGVVMMLVFAACSGEKDYVNVIPADVSLVASFDLEQLVENCELSEADYDKLKSEVGKAVKDGMDARQTAVIDRIMADPLESGVDFRKKAYMFAMPEAKEVAFLFSVSDKDKLDALMNAMGESLEEADGCRYMMPGEKSVMIYNESVLLFAGTTAGTAEALKQKVFGWISGKGASYAATEEFRKLEAAEGEIAMVTSLDIMPQQYKMMGAMSLPQGVELKDIKNLVSLCFEKGELVMDIEALYLTDAVRNMAEDQKKVYGGKVTDKFFGKFPADAMVWLGLNMNGKELYTYLLNNPVVGSQLQQAGMPVDAGKVMSAIDGEIAFGAWEEQGEPLFSFYAEVNNDDFLSDLDAFKFLFDKQHIRFGIEDNVFYLTNGREEEPEKTLADAAWAEEAEGKLVFGAMNIRSYAALMSGLSPNSAVVATAVVMMYGDDYDHSRLVLAMKDKDANVLKQWIDLAKKMNGLN